MRTFLRKTAKLLAVIGILVLLVAAFCAGIVWLTLPPAAQDARIPGLLAPVQVGFDADGVPRIHATSATDAAAALGFVHARDRMFQMELMRRAASGRLSELAGPAALPIDLLMRTPEHWQPVDSLLWAKTMGLWLSDNWRVELSRQALAGQVPQHLIDELWPSEGGGHPDASLPAATRFAQVSQRLMAVLPRFPGPFTLPNSASNEWAVDGRHTATGAPLLAGDPHLAFGFPGIWYLARIETPGHVLVGATAPGVPFLVLGHNGHIAWTFTSTGADVQDVFIETPIGDGEYQTPDGPKPFVVREERIKVRGKPDELLTVRETRHGPVVS